MNQPVPETMTGFVYVLGSVLFTVYGQLVVKWRVGKAGTFPTVFSQKLLFLTNLLMSPWIMSGVTAGFFALLCWLAAMTKFELSYAYPFMSLAFVFVLILSALLFHEPVTVPKVLGVLFIMVGIFVTSRG